MDPTRKRAMRVLTQEQKDQRSIRRRALHAEKRAAGWVRPSRRKGPIAGPAWADALAGNRGPADMAFTYEEIAEARRCDDQVVVIFHREHPADFTRV